MTGYATEAERRHAVFCLDQALASHKLEGIDPSPLALEYRAKIKKGKATIDDWIKAAQSEAQRIANETGKPIPTPDEVIFLQRDREHREWIANHRKPISKFWLFLCSISAAGWALLLLALAGIKVF